MAEQRMQWSVPEISGTTPQIKNHTATLVDGVLYVFGGYDGRRNHSALRLFDCETRVWTANPQTSGTIPEGRNGHTATLAGRKLYILGGWLGIGPHAASDMHILDVDAFKWQQSDAGGKWPGPCNMHTADYFPSMNSILVFRGGDGSAYLNELHRLDLGSNEWVPIPCTGTKPLPRANHSSAIVDEQLFIFGGWDGHRRLNDIHILDTKTLHWSSPQISGILPNPRAGMTFTAIRGQIYLFGGSGPASKCFNDLQIFDPVERKWRIVVTVPESARNSTNYEHVSSDPGNPNAEDSDRVIVCGRGPSLRAGHTATVVGRRLLIFGGSHGTGYLADFYELDTDPPPSILVSSVSPLQLMQSKLEQFFDNMAFSDVTFVVQDQEINAHRLVLTTMSERFRALFSNGFLESSEKRVVIEDASYHVFRMFIQYLYTGEFPSKRSSASAEDYLADVGELLQLADQYMIDHLKELCEAELVHAVDENNIHNLMQLADHHNAFQLRAACMHFARNV